MGDTRNLSAIMRASPEVGSPGVTLVVIIIVVIAVAAFAAVLLVFNFVWFFATKSIGSSHPAISKVEVL
jgi:hypothetical protein